MRDARDPTRPTPVTQQPGSKKAVLESQGTPKRWPPGSQKEPLGEPGVPQERHTEAASHPEPMEAVRSKHDPPPRVTCLRVRKFGDKP